MVVVVWFRLCVCLFVCVCVLRPHAHPVVIAIYCTSICVLTYCDVDHRLFLSCTCLTLVQCFGTEDIVSICGDCLRRDMTVTSPFPLKREPRPFCGNDTQYQMKTGIPFRFWYGFSGWVWWSVRVSRAKPPAMRKLCGVLCRFSRWRFKAIRMAGRGRAGDGEGEQKQEQRETQSQV